MQTVFVTIYRYLNVLLEMLIPKIYGFMGLTCKLKALREDMDFRDNFIYTSEKPTLQVGFWPTINGL